MVDTVVCNLDLYKLPQNEILHNRVEFYGLKRETTDTIEQWLNRVQTCIIGCDLPTIVIEFLLIDRLICGLNTAEMDVIRRSGSWSLKQIIERFGYQKGDTVEVVIDENVASDENIPIDTVESEPVSGFS